MGSYWNRSGTVERYADDLRAAGAKAYFYEGGTTTAFTVYRNSAESAAHPHPVVADANGRWPDVFVPFIASYDVRVTSADSVQLTYSVEIPNADPIEVPDAPAGPEQLIATGMIHPEIVNTTRSGYVRCNGRSIGNPNSGAGERADDDTANLYTYLWNNLADAICPVTSGRGSSAAADFAANKDIALPDLRGAALVGLDDMGNSAGSFFTGLTFATGGAATTPGSSTGANPLVLLQANLPAVVYGGTTAGEAAHTHTGTTAVDSPSHTHSGTTDGGTDHSHGFSGNTDDESVTHTHTYSVTGNNNQGGVASGGGLNVNSGASTDSTGTESATHQHPFSGTTAVEGDHTHTFTSGNPSVSHTHTFTSAAGSNHSHTFVLNQPLGSATPINNLGRSALVTWYIKL